MFAPTQGYTGESCIHISQPCIWSRILPQRCGQESRGLFFTAHFFSELGNNGHYSGHGRQIWLLNCIQTHITHSATSPFLCIALKCFSVLFFPVCCLSGEGSYERSTAQGHARLIAPLNEVIHNVTALPYRHTHTHTCTHIFLCLPQDILKQSPLRQGCRKVNLTE